jgi:hypothetical protein
LPKHSWRYGGPVRADGDNGTSTGDNVRGSPDIRHFVDEGQAIVNIGKRAEVH